MKPPHFISLEQGQGTGCLLWSYSQGFRDRTIAREGTLEDSLQDSVFPPHPRDEVIGVIEDGPMCHSGTIDEFTRWATSSA